MKATTTIKTKIKNVLKVMLASYLALGVACGGFYTIRQILARVFSPSAALEKNRATP